MSKKLDVETDDVFQKRDWWAERIMWFLLLLFVLAGLLGFFGRGGLSLVKAGSVSEKIEVEYQRFLRYHTKDRIDISLYDLTAAAEISVGIDKNYADKIQVEDIFPKPIKTVLTSNGVNYFFENQGAKTAKIIFYLHPDKLGNVKTQLMVNGSFALSLNQYIYP